MADYTAVRIEDMEAIYGGAMFRARASLGASSFGLSIFELPAEFDAYPEHDHSDDGQEEVYVVLSGSAEIDIEGDTVHLDPSTVVRVGPGTRRKIRTGAEPVRILAIGGVPGSPYEPPQSTQLGEPDPLTG
ncbi:MAG: cupin domain-containing protein [Solirubrobacterales bacterium]